MNRIANYTIKGFLYQFNVTLLNILDSSDDAVITVEGLIEDIDIETDTGINAIQCKYHETAEKFVLSSVCEPILQMMVHFKNNPASQIAYALYAHFPNEQIGEKRLSIENLKTIIGTSAEKLKRYTKILTSTTKKMKEVPHLLWIVVYFFTFFIVSFSLCS